MYSCLGHLVRYIKKHLWRTATAVSHSSNVPPPFPHADRCRFHILTLSTNAQVEDVWTHPLYQIPAGGSESSANQPTSGSPCWSSQLWQGLHNVPQTQKAAKQNPVRLRLPTAKIRQDKNKFAHLPQIKFLGRCSQTSSIPICQPRAPITFLHSLNQNQKKSLMLVPTVQCSGFEAKQHRISTHWKL